MRELAAQGPGPVAERARDVTGSPESRVEADENEPDDDCGPAREREVPEAQRDAPEPEPEEEVARREDEDASSVGAEAARADDDQDEHGHDRNERRAEKRSAQEAGHEEQRLHLVGDPVEADAAVRVRAERGQRAGLGREREHERVHDEDREQRAGEDEPRARDGCESGRAGADGHEQRQAHVSRPCDLQAAERERRSERTGPARSAARPQNSERSKRVSSAKNAPSPKTT